ncbi:MAG: hypothetical protein COC19_04845 [SAR86 cluster bacterium]|uniref:DUF4156 domain-containing protein n=1 Tax=SAR86 cluster bacterium TaxID=2030880 RepID=A0A2A4MMQ1_9GAMM|nr:MAG: hypothetical protein COC19_04845 [SAR86 cluster bacterium]
MIRSLIFSLITLSLLGCNWVQLTNAGQGVRLATPSEVGNCTLLGNANSKTLSKLVVIPRGGSKQQAELLTLARNEAGDMGGNVVVPESLIEQGSQTFNIYRCP